MWRKMRERKREREEWEVNLGCTKLVVSWTFLWGVDKGSQWRKWKQAMKEWWWVLSYEGVLHVSCRGHEKVGFLLSATIEILSWKQMKPMWKLGVTVRLQSKPNYESLVLELEVKIYPWCNGKIAVELHWRYRNKKNGKGCFGHIKETNRFFKLQFVSFSRQKLPY